MKGMNGHIIAGTSICVDYWKWTPGKKYLHFLTHLHSDHTVGLKSTFRENIYTSPFNAWLLERWFKIDPDLIIRLTIGDTHIIYDSNSGKYISVTLIDANHCPGSTMFLFQGNFGNILYTGDFRYEHKMLDHPMLKSVIENEVVHQLYLDNTFAAEHCNFPSRDEALEMLMTLIRNHPDHFIVLGVRKLGKEDVFWKVAVCFNEQILVSEERLKILTYLNFPNVFTTDKSKARIMVKEMHEINRSFLYNLRLENGPVLTILLTALYSLDTGNGKCGPKVLDKVTDIHHVPFSDHCSHSELLKFVSQVRPHTIFPIVLTKQTKKCVDNVEGTSTDSQYNCNLKKLCESSIIPANILKLSRNQEASIQVDCEPPIVWNCNKPNGKDNVTDQTESETNENGSKKIKADQIQCKEIHTLPSESQHTQYYSQDGESQGFFSCDADVMAYPFNNEEYCTMSDEELSQKNIAVKPLSEEPDLNSGFEDYMSTERGKKAIKMPDVLGLTEFRCNKALSRPFSQIDAIINTQNLCQIDSPVQSTSKYSLPSNVKEFTIDNITSIKTHTMLNDEYSTRPEFNSQVNNQNKGKIMMTATNALFNEDDSPSDYNNQNQIKGKITSTSTLALVDEDDFLVTTERNCQFGIQAVHNISANISQDNDQMKLNVMPTTIHSFLKEDASMSEVNSEIIEEMKSKIMPSSTLALINEDDPLTAPGYNWQYDKKTVHNVQSTKTCIHIENDDFSLQGFNCDQTQAPTPSSPNKFNCDESQASLPSSPHELNCDQSQASQPSFLPYNPNYCDQSQASTPSSPHEPNCDQSQASPASIPIGINNEFNSFLNTCDVNTNEAVGSPFSSITDSEKRYFDDLLSNLWEVKSPEIITPISDKFNHLLATQSEMKSDSFFSKRSNSVSDNSPSLIMKNNVLLEPLQHTTTLQALNLLDNSFYERFPTIYKEWYDSVQFESLEKHIQLIKPIEDNHVDMWQSYDWEAVLKRKGRKN